MTVLPHSALWTSSLTCTWWRTWWAPTSTTSSRPSDFQTIMFSFLFIRLSEAWNMFTRLGSFTGKYYFLLFDDFWRLWCICDNFDVNHFCDFLLYWWKIGTEKKHDPFYWWWNTFVLILPQRKIFWLPGINPTPVQGGRFLPPPYQKMPIIPKNNDLKEPKPCDFSYISMTNPVIPLMGLKMAKKGVSMAF